MSLIPNKASQKIFRQVLQFKKNSPHIFFGAGIVGFIGTTVLASRATLKLDAVLDTFTEDLEQVKGPDQDNKDVAYVYGKGSMAIAKLYAPAALLGTASIVSLTGSHVIMTKRNTALAGTLAVVTQAFEDYRDRVKTEVGDDKELDLRFNLSEIETTDEDGNKKLVKLADPSLLSPYARFFDEYSTNWQRDQEYNLLYILCQQNYANDRLQAHGHVFLNEVYEWLGIEHSRAGSVVGWVLDGNGDGYVDFGVFDVENRDFLHGPNKSILLDFNVDGIIYDKI